LITRGTYIIEEMEIKLPPLLSMEYQHGGIIGVVNMIDCVTSHSSKWFFGKYGYVFVDPQRLKFTPCKGQLGIFEAKI